MIKKHTWLFIVIVNGVLVGCSTNSRSLSRVSIENTYEGCYLNLGGEVRLMTCPKHLPDLISQERIESSKASFSSFIDSPRAEIALDRSIARDDAGIVIDSSNLQNEGDEIDMMIGPRFIASMYFRVYSSSSSSVRRYGSPFNKSEEPVEKWAHRILTNILGQGYERFSPKLKGVNNETVSMDVLFSDIHELKILLKKSNLVSIRHIGDPIHPLEEIAI